MKAVEFKGKSSIKIRSIGEIQANPIVNRADRRMSADLVFKETLERKAMGEKFLGNFTSQKDRPDVLLLGCGSGGGKSRSLDYMSDIVYQTEKGSAICVTFNDKTPCTIREAGLSFESMLCLRICERVVCVEGSCFDDFVWMWLKSPFLSKNLDVNAVILYLAGLCEHKLFIGIDEYSKSGKSWEDVIAATQSSRGYQSVQFCYTALKAEVDDTGAQVGFSSTSITKSIWLYIAAAGELEQNTLSKKVDSCIEALFQSKDIESKRVTNAKNCAIALSSGHWRTLAYLVSKVADRSCFSDDYHEDNKALLEALKNTVCVKASYHLALVDIMAANMFGVEVMITAKLGGTAVVDLMNNAFLLNSLQSVFVSDIRRFVPFTSIAVLLSLQYPNYSLTNEALIRLRDSFKQIQYACLATDDLPKNFERALQSILQLRFNLWWDSALLNGVEWMRLACEPNEDMSEKHVFLPGHALIIGRQFQVKKPEGPVPTFTLQGQDKLETMEWRCTKGKSISVTVPCVIMPGFDQQAAVDLLIPLILMGTDDNQERCGLLFVQAKFSADFTNGAQIHIEKDMKSIIKYRNTLFWKKKPSPKNIRECLHPIGKLGVLEKDVILCYSVLRKLPVPTKSVIQTHANGIGFEGTVLVDLYPQTDEDINLFTRHTLYGSVLGRLGLFLSSHLKPV